jgi:hypothetical protein
LGIGALAALIYLTRYNDLPLALVLIGGTLVLPIQKAIDLRAPAQRVALALASATPLIYVFKLLAAPPKSATYDFFAKYLLTTLTQPGFLWEHFVYMLFGANWGLLYSAPFLLLALLGWARLRGVRLWISLLLLCGVLSNLYIAVAMGTAASFYGYRYLLFTFIPALMLPLGAFLESYLKPGLTTAHRRVRLAALGLTSLLPLLSMLLFQGNGTTLTLSYIPVKGAVGQGMDFDNATYQIEVWRTVFLAPKEFVVALLKGVPAYLGYLAWILTAHSARLPAALLEKYPTFESRVLFQTLLLLALPYGLYLSARRYLKS